MGQLAQPKKSLRGLVFKSTDLVSSPRSRLGSSITICAIVFAFFLYDRKFHENLSIMRSLSSRPFRIRPQTPKRPDLPPLLSNALHPHIGRIYDFTVPQLMSYYEDELPNGHTKLYFVTSGIMMNYAHRNFSAAGCLVGDDVYPATKFVSEVIQCIISRRLKQGEKLAPVIAYDDVLKRAEAGPVTLATDIVAELFPGDITSLPTTAVLHGNLTNSRRFDFRLARSAHRVGPSDHFVREEAKLLPRYQLCQMTMVAPNSHMIPDWANYHRRIGVDKIFIFDNGAEIDLKQMYEGRPDIEVVSWPYHKSQVQAVSQFLFMSRARCERIFMHDSDEYMMFGLGDGTCLTTGERPLIRYAKMAREKGFQHAKVLYLIMSNSGFLRRPQGEVPTNYIHRREIQRFQNGKTICLVDAADWEAGSIHQCGYRNGTKINTYSDDITKWGDLKMKPEEVDDPPFLLHFRQRSWEEWIDKWDAGRVSGAQMADPKAGMFTMDNPLQKFMEVRPEMRYAHFRDKIYSRVMKEGRLDEQIIVQTKNGKRCEMLYKIVDNSVTGPVREKCS